MIGADGEVRAAAVRVTNKGKASTLCRPIQHLVRRSQKEDTTQEDTIDLEPEDNLDQEPVTERPRRAAAARARDRILQNRTKLWYELVRS